MGEDDKEVEPAEPESLITLHDFYKSTQDHLIKTTERSLDLDRKDLAEKLDDVLLRQRFWEDDIQLEEGALSDLEANDAVASSIIRRYLDEILRLLHDFDDMLSIPLSDANHEKEKTDLLHETNSRLCDQVEIFDAIAATGTADAAKNDRKATPVGRLRRRVEEENERREGILAQFFSIPSPSGESGSPTGTIQSPISSGKRKVSPEPSSAIATPIPHSSTPEDTGFGRPGITINTLAFWICSDCRHINNKAYCPEKCGNCGHTKCAACNTCK